MGLIRDLDLKKDSDSSFLQDLHSSPQKPDFPHPSVGFESVLRLTKRTWVFRLTWTQTWVHKSLALPLTNIEVKFNAGRTIHKASSYSFT